MITIRLHNKIFTNNDTLFLSRRTYKDFGNYLQYYSLHLGASPIEVNQYLYMVVFLLLLRQEREFDPPKVYQIILFNKVGGIKLTII